MRIIVVAICVAFAATAEAQDKQWQQYPLLLWGTTNSLRPLKWGPARFGTGVHVTYSLLRRPRSFPPVVFVNCLRMEPIDTLLATTHIRIEDFRAEVDRAFEQWSTVAGISFEYTHDDSRADIVIGMANAGRLASHSDYIGFANVLPEDRAGDTHRIVKSAICLSPHVAWSLADVPTRVHTAPVLRHEIGHAIGIAHSRVQNGAVMLPSVGKVVGLSKFEIETITFLYGRSRLVHWP